MGVAPNHRVWGYLPLHPSLPELSLTVLLCLACPHPVLMLSMTAPQRHISPSPSGLWQVDLWLSDLGLFTDLRSPEWISFKQSVPS